MKTLLPGTEMKSQPEPVASVGRLWAARWLLPRPSGEASALAASAGAMNTIKAITMASLVGIIITIIPPRICLGPAAQPRSSGRLRPDPSPLIHRTLVVAPGRCERPQNSRRVVVLRHKADTRPRAPYTLAGGVLRGT